MPQEEAENESMANEVVAEPTNQREVRRREALPKRILQLSREFAQTFKLMPVFNQAIVDRYWQSLTDEQGQGNAVRFEMDGERYAVELKFEPHRRQWVSMSRRSTEGIKELDMAGTSSEELNRDYWQEHLRMEYNWQRPKEPYMVYFKRSPNNPEGNVHLVNEDAEGAARDLLADLRAKIPKASLPAGEQNAP